MMNLLPHHRRHIPNGLAVFAAFLLLMSTAVGYNIRQEAYSSNQNTTPSERVETNTNEDLSDRAENRRRGLNLGLLLFRR